MTEIKKNYRNINNIICTEEGENEQNVYMFTYIYIYIYMCVCVCMCVNIKNALSSLNFRFGVVLRTKDLLNPVPWMAWYQRIFK
jgi:hypothetical protein